MPITELKATYLLMRRTVAMEDTHRPWTFYPILSACLCAFFSLFLLPFPASSIEDKEPPITFYTKQTLKTKEILKITKISLGEEKEKQELTGTTNSARPKKLEITTPLELESEEIEIIAQVPPQSKRGNIQIITQAAEMPEEGETTLSLSLRECLALALDNNLNIALARYDPQQAETRIKEEKADFHPTANFSADKGRETKPQSSRFKFFGKGVRSRTLNNTRVNWGLQQKFAFGTEYDLNFNLNREMDNPFGGRGDRGERNIQSEYIGNLSFTLTQHLLRDLGYDVNRSEILVAQNNRDISKQDFKEKVEEIIAQVEQTYWNLVFSIEDLKVKQQSLGLAKDLLERNKIQVRVGTMAPIEILEAETQVASREEEIIRAEKTVEDTEDRLRKLINVPEYPLLHEARVIPTDKPTFAARKIRLIGSINQALQNRSDYRKAKLNLDNTGIEIKVTKNRLMPQLDLIAKYSNHSLEESTQGSMADLFDMTHHSWNFGINIQIPLGNQEARSRYTRVRIEKEKARTVMKNLEQDIILKIKEAVRAVQTNTKRVESTRISSRLFKERLDAEEKRFSVGLSTSRDILEDQEQLAEAQSREIEAIIDYNKSLVELERQRGTILDKHRIELF